jgi:hypothetical protein
MALQSRDKLVWAHHHDGVLNAFDINEHHLPRVFLQVMLWYRLRSGLWLGMQQLVVMLMGVLVQWHAI